MTSLIVNASANASTPSKVDEKTKDIFESHMNDVVSEFKKMEVSGRLKPEPMLNENPQRFVLFPIKQAEVWSMYKKAEASFWTAEELAELFEMEWCIRLLANKNFLDNIPRANSLKE